MENESPVAVYPLDGEAEANQAFGTEATTGSYLPPTTAPAQAAPRQPLKTWLAGGLAAAVFGIGGFFGIQALTNHSHSTTTANGVAGFPGGGGRGAFPDGRGGTQGTIKDISGSTLTLTTRDGSTLTVTTSASTTVTKAATASASAIKAGDHVVVQTAQAAQTPSSGSVTADRIIDSGATAADAPGGPPGGGAPITGTVASVGNGTFTVTETGGTTVTVKTTATTIVTVVQPSSFAALEVGDSVGVSGTTTNGTVAATSIQSGSADFGPGGPRGGFPPGGGFGSAPPTA